MLSSMVSPYVTCVVCTHTLPCWPLHESSQMRLFLLQFCLSHLWHWMKRIENHAVEDSSVTPNLVEICEKLLKVYGKKMAYYFRPDRITNQSLMSRRELWQRLITESNVSIFASRWLRRTPAATIGLHCGTINGRSVNWCYYTCLW